MIVFGYPLWAGVTGRLAAAPERAPSATPLPWSPPSLARWALSIIAVVYVILGIFFLLAVEARPASGSTPGA